MTEADFDPYWQWLGIAPHEQPADHYRLLGLPRYENDPAKIAAAASVVGAIIGEAPGGVKEGLGRALVNFNQQYITGPEKLWGTILIASLAGIAFYVLVRVVELIALRGQPLNLLVRGVQARLDPRRVVARCAADPARPELPMVVRAERCLIGGSCGVRAERTREMSRAVDRGANVAAVVGIGMALTIAVSFLMVIPIDPAYLILAPLSGLLIGWYGNQRAEQLRSRPGRVLANAAWSGGVTAVTFAAGLAGASRNSRSARSREASCGSCPFNR